MNVDFKSNPRVIANNYGNVSIMGEISELDLNTDYKITGIPTKNKYGTTYKVVSISRDKPVNQQETYQFLRTICTERQASELYLHYPNIIQMVLDNEDVDLSLVKGIKDVTFEKIKNKIIDNFMLIDLINEFKGYISLNVLRKMYSKYTSIEIVRKKIIQEPYKCMCSLSGIGFKSADELLLKLQKNRIVEFGYNLRTSLQRCRECILYNLTETENNGSTRINILKLLSIVKSVTPECSQHFFEAIKDDDIYYNKDKNNDVFVSRKVTYEAEMYIKYRINEALEINDIYEVNPENYRTIDEYELTDDQLSSIHNLCKSQFSILVGYSGTGKSFSAKAIINMLTDKSKWFALFAPTGKAAKVLSEYTGSKAETIHTGLGYQPPTWRYNSFNKLNCDVLIIDEFSMADVFLFKTVLEAIDFNITKLLVIGDPAQLPSVGCGNVMHDLLTSKKIPKTMLTKVFRYGEGGLMKVATDVRNCKLYLTKYDNKVTAFGENKDYLFMNYDKEAGLDCIKKVYAKTLERYSTSDVVVLSSYRKGDYGCININRLLQPIANKERKVSDIHIEAHNTNFYVNDIVMQTKNNRKAFLVSKGTMWGEDCYDFINEQTFIANGESGVIVDITKRGLIVIDFNGLLVGYEKTDMQNVELAYSCTLHKFQGSAAKVVILFTPSSHTYMLNSNLIYVGLTRMKEKCFHIGDLDTVNRAILKKENLSRNTWLNI
ncbi:exodeoxyribonuclease V alpha subunit [Thomasclavelia cocleata]|uniref:Exodeoxyribonuclease V alpha subunit n=1 Tax=Thomasclavelia cocleata TaxID=69824 RepID=A0A1I0BGG9_9FIRM|nr:AAA family ATPase [Thomasclavelia cocleata]MCR1959886.1 AAA family ATPase [Thomasclavelia cocleata]SET05680.1 exodeoxyribonuclease V alpha subunit [Thomasclavelia cocleata]